MGAFRALYCAHRLKSTMRAARVCTHIHTELQPTPSLFKCTTNPELQGKAISGGKLCTVEIIYKNIGSHYSISLA